MRTELWLQTRQERAERVLQDHGGDLSAVLQAFREVTDDPVSEEAARIVGRALRVMPVEAFLYTLRQAKEAVIRAADAAASDASAAIAAASAKARADGLHPGSVRVCDVRPRPGEDSRGMLLELAAALQALSWAISPPSERHGPISY